MIGENAGERVGRGREGVGEEENEMLAVFEGETPKLREELEDSDTVVVGEGEGVAVGETELVAVSEGRDRTGVRV